MGLLYSVVTLDAECAEWLDDEGVSHPQPVPDPRFPTPREVAVALQELSGYSVELDADQSSGEWLAHIASLSSPEMWASLRVRDYGSDDVPHKIYFPKGWPEVVFAVVRCLTSCCGPLVVVDDSSMRPVVVCATDSVEDLLLRYGEV